MSTLKLECTAGFVYPVSEESVNVRFTGRAATINGRNHNVEPIDPSKDAVARVRASREFEPDQLETLRWDASRQTWLDQHGRPTRSGHISG